MFVWFELWYRVLYALGAYDVLLLFGRVARLHGDHGGAGPGPTGRVSAIGHRPAKVVQ